MNLDLTQQDLFDLQLSVSLRIRQIESIFDASAEEHPRKAEIGRLELLLIRITNAIETGE